MANLRVCKVYHDNRSNIRAWEIVKREREREGIYVVGGRDRRRKIMKRYGGS